MPTWNELIAKLGMDGRGYTQTLDDAEKKTGHFASKGKQHITGFAGHVEQELHHIQYYFTRLFTVAAIEEFGRHMVESVIRIKDLSQQFNISTTEVQRLDVAAEKSGQKVEDIGGGLLKFHKARIEAIQGNEALRRSFERMGISIEDINDSNVSDLFLVMTHAKEIAKDPALNELFGKSGQKLATVFDALKDVHIHPIAEEDINAIKEAEHGLQMLKREMEALLAAGAGTFSRSPGLLLSPVPTMASVLADRLRDRFFPASADHPRARSDEMVGPMPSGDTLVSQRELALKILKMEEEVQSRIFKMQEQGMTVEQKRVALLARAQDHVNKANMFGKMGKPEDAARERAGFVDAMTELNALELGARPSKAGLGLTSNQRAGAGIMLGAGSALAIGTRQADKTVAENTKKTVEAVKELTSVVRSNSGVKPTLFGAE